MFNIFKKNPESSSKWPKLFLAIFLPLLLIVILGASAVGAYEYYFKDKVVKGVMLGDISLAGKSQSEISSIINKKIDEISGRGLGFSYQSKLVTVESSVSAINNPDLTIQILFFDAEKMASLAFEYGHSPDLVTNLKNQALALAFDYQVPLKFELNKVELEKVLKLNFSELENPPNNASWQIDDHDYVTIAPEKNGTSFDYQKAMMQMEANINLDEIEPVALDLIAKNAQITYADLLAQKSNLEKFLADHDKLTLTYVNEYKKEFSWEIEKKVYQKWLSVCLMNGNLNLCFDEGSLRQKLDSISSEINIEPQDAKLVMADNVVKEFQPSKNGVELDLDKSIETINQQAFKENNLTIGLITKIWEPKVATGETNDLGIKERIGLGHSNFSGSPTNRRKNIAVGLKKLNGLLIKPDEEFSAMKNLVPVTGANGYLEELVIKGNKTIPEFGGGLCQIGTTLFRVALDAGLPITERRPHSYRVTYYEPAGMDATIYDPHPDLRFKNDTGHYLMLTGFIDGNDIYFELWGTSDGRKAEISKPSIYNITSPGPTKIVETLDLAPGVKKCTERAHNGADASFTRTITFTDGREIIKETYNSHYVPWQAVCLVGVAALTEPTPETPTEPVIPE